MYKCREWMGDVCFSVLNNWCVKNKAHFLNESETIVLYLLFENSYMISVFESLFCFFYFEQTLDTCVGLQILFNELK